MGSPITFQYFTYFLNPLDQQALFSDKREKNEIFRSLLNKRRIEYSNRGVELALILVSEKDGNFICKLGKRASLKKNLPPDKNFEETLEETWPYCLVVINTNPDNGQGQKIAFEYKSHIFLSPHEQLKHFEDEINTSLAGSGYILAVNPVTEEREFWKIVEANEDNLEKLTFTFNAPNLFGLKNTLNQDLKDLENEYGSTKISIELENPAGKLKIPKNELTRQGIDYITKGGGEYELRIKGKTKKAIKSKNKILTRTFDDLDITLKGKGQEALFDIFDRIFG